MPESGFSSDPFAMLFPAHPWHGVPARAKAAGAFNAFIEIVPTDTVKYEIDKEVGHLRIDRPQLFSSICPTPYGFIPQTYCGPTVAARCSERTGQAGVAGDGDPLDICVLTEKVVSHSNLYVSARPIGGFRMIDGNQADDKIIAVLEADLAYGHMRDLADCPPGVLDRLRHYFLTYKQRPDEKSDRVSIPEIYDSAEALEVIDRSLVDYRDAFGDPEARLAALRSWLTRD